MKIEELTYRIHRRQRLVSLVLLSLVLLLTACSDDSIEEKKNTRKQTVTILPYYASFLEVNRTPTRSLPYGYVPYRTLYPTTVPDHATIGIILATNNDYDNANYSVTIDKDAQGNATNHWTSVIDVQEGTTYYIYGFMPKEDAGRATLAKPDGGDYSTGCILTVNDLNTLTSSDVCVVVAVGKSKGDANSNPYDITDINMPISLGKFEYTSDFPYLYLLLKHLYAGLHFKAHVDTEYAKLRTIKVTNMTLTTRDKISDKINLIVTINANDVGDDPVTNIVYEDAVATASYNYGVTQLFPRDGNPATEFEVPTQTTEEFLSCFAPAKCSSFILTSTYDVYDKKGNRIRKDCTAVNKIDANSVLRLSELKAGEIYTIDLKIEPTYLYVLSDPDIDNPTFRITGE